MSLGSTKAALNLGNLFAEGLGVQQSTPTAIELYKTAADAGLVEELQALAAGPDVLRAGEGGILEMRVLADCVLGCLVDLREGVAFYLGEPGQFHCC